MGIDIISGLAYFTIMSDSTNDPVKAYLRDIGAKGGRKSRRSLDPAQARRMVAVREARKAFNDHYTELFWSAPEDMTIGEAEVPYVINQLKAEGNREAFLEAGKIMRLWKTGDDSCR